MIRILFAFILLLLQSNVLTAERNRQLGYADEVVYNVEPKTFIEDETGIPKKKVIVSPQFVGNFYRALDRKNLKEMDNIYINFLDEGGTNFVNYLDISSNKTSDRVYWWNVYCVRCILMTKNNGLNPYQRKSHKKVLDDIVAGGGIDFKAIEKMSPKAAKELSYLHWDKYSTKNKEALAAKKRFETAKGIADSFANLVNTSAAVSQDAAVYLGNSYKKILLKATEERKKEQERLAKLEEEKRAAKAEEIKTEQRTKEFHAALEKGDIKQAGKILAEGKVDKIDEQVDMCMTKMYEFSENTPKRERYFGLLKRILEGGNVVSGKKQLFKKALENNDIETALLLFEKGALDNERNDDIFYMMTRYAIDKNTIQLLKGLENKVGLYNFLAYMSTTECEKMVNVMNLLVENNYGTEKLQIWFKSTFEENTMNFKKRESTFDKSFWAKYGGNGKLKHLIRKNNDGAIEHLHFEEGGTVTITSSPSETEDDFKCLSKYGSNELIQLLSKN